MTHAGQSPDPHLVPHWESAALVTIDMQVDFLSGSPYGLAGTTEIVPNLRRVTDAFRAAQRPIVHIVRLYQPDGTDADLARRTLLADGARIVAPGSPGSQLAPGLLPTGAPQLDHVRLLGGKPQELNPTEYVIFKPRWGAFYRTPLAALLDDLAVDTIVFAGCNLPNCPRASIIEASERDYRIVLATDAVSQASLHGFREVAGIGVQLLTSDEITAALPAVH
ncbi:isochorismatase family cysteine hydrolase [Micromonospora sp. NPDC049523]|uniref:cysteine hydrolase family protein n=1 Tax=Micromonospora sp. NPDC049523 TaxID=3155921 RepID=UPI00341367D8